MRPCWNRVAPFTFIHSQQHFTSLLSAA